MSKLFNTLRDVLTPYANKINLHTEEIEEIQGDVSEVKADLDGLPVTPTGELLVSGYYIKNTGVVTASANFKTYKYDVSEADFVRVTTYGYNSTIAVASNTDYDASSLPGKTFPSSDVFIIPEGTISSIQAWTAERLTNGKSYLYISCYKNKEPTVYAYTDNGAYPRSLQNESDVSTIKTEMNSVFASYTSLLNTADKWTPFSNNANNLTPNRTFVVTYSTNISNLPYSGFAGFLSVYMAYYGNTSILMQDATRGNAKEIYRRVNWSGAWTAWNRVANDEDVKGMVSDVHALKYTADLWMVFHKVGVIGDSLASGESASNEGDTVSYHDLYPFSWGQCLARESGNTYYNFSKGGLTAKTWMTDADYGYALASQSDKLCDAYIIGLGQNDSGQHMTVGTSADINLTNPDLNADSFYGNYGKIIQKMQIIAPKAPIFVISRPTVPPSNEYETAIRAMPTIFSNVYLIDLYKYVNDFYDSNSIIRQCLRSGHYNAVAYKTISKYISQEISNVIVANLNDFLQVEFINTKWSWTN